MGVFPQWVEDGVGSPGTGVSSSYEEPDVDWELNSDSLDHRATSLVPVLLAKQVTG